jgi:hypothetical protein
VAAWLSETVLPGCGPGACEFESHRRRRIFFKEGTSAGPWMCVYVFQGLMVGWCVVLCCIRVVLSRKEKRGWPWESTPEPRRT